MDKSDKEFMTTTDKHEEKLTRERLEQLVIDKLQNVTPQDIPLLKDALSRRTALWLEDLLKRMKEAGR
jgi:hypothetical protein